MKKRLSFGAILAAILLTVLAVSTVYGQGAGQRVSVLIGFAQQPGAAEEALVRGAGGTVSQTFHLVPAIAATIPESAINGLINNPRITVIELNGQFQATDAELDNSWGVLRIGAGTVHAAGNQGAGVKVAIIDSGIDYNHPDLDANYAGGYDFVNGDNDPLDDNGHGTHVAGTVAAEDDDAGVVGVAPQASIYALKVLGPTGSGSFQDIIAALQWAVDKGIQVTNNSYGSDGDPGSLVQAAFDNSAALGIIHVASAGNSGNPPGKGDNVGWPANYDSVIAVAATNDSDSRATFSSTGDNVELAAPGVTINSTLLGGGYGTKNGTSMASPHVAGVAALILSNGSAKEDVRGILQSTADDLGKAGRDSKYGFGLVDAAEAATPTGPVNAPPVVSITSPSDGADHGSGASIAFAGGANDAEDGDLTASLVWTSSLDGAIGAGGNFSATLSDGVHTITASVTDGGGATRSDSISITVGTPPPPPPPPALAASVVTDKAVYIHGEDAIITVTATEGGNPASGAAVQVVISTSKGGTLSANASTDANGEATFVYHVNSKRDGAGTYNVDATASKDGSQATASTTFEVQGKTKGGGNSK